MAKLRTERVIMDGSEKKELDFKYDINVNKDGTFTTTLPQDIVTRFESANIDLSKNQLRRKGYFSAPTIDKLINEVRECCKEYLSRKQISHEIVIQYNIQTTCTYCLDVNGQVVPNAGSEWTKFKERQDDDWKEGTETQHATQQHPFGIQIYAKPFHKRKYRYKSGKVKTEYEAFTPFGGGEAEDSQYYLKWLEGVASIAEPDGGELMEIPYTEEVAKVFVDMLKGICMINEKIKEFIVPEGIQKIADNKLKMLS